MAWPRRHFWSHRAESRWVWPCWLTCCFKVMPELQNPLFCDCLAFSLLIAGWLLKLQQSQTVSMCRVRRENICISVSFLRMWDLPRSPSTYLPSSVTGKSWLICWTKPITWQSRMKVPDSLRPAGLHLWIMDMWGSPRSFQRVTDQTISAVALRYSWSFKLCRYLYL